MCYATQLEQFPLAIAPTALGQVGWRAAAAPGYTGPVTHVLLHGIGSASASWLAQLVHVSRSPQPAVRVVAWDAPGYGDSTAPAAAVPRARDYAQQVWAWLDTLGADAASPLVLVGHSLGALIAASAAALQPARVTRLVLLAPAQGHAQLPADERHKKLDDRLAALEQFGPAGMAQRRAGAMLSPGASAQQIAWVGQIMAGIDPAGYRQASRMLSGGDISADLAGLQLPIQIGCGSADTITPVGPARALAARFRAGFTDLGPVGHSCPLEAATAVNQLLGFDTQGSA